MSEAYASYDDAEALRKGGSLLEAGKQFAALWKQRPTPSVGWRYVFCLRKLGYLERAEQVARQVVDTFPKDDWCKSELIWVLYEKELKPAQKENDLGRALQAANEIMTTNPTGLGLHKTAFTVMKVAKKRGHWDVVLEWAEKLTPEQLSPQPSEYNGKRVMADREVWYIARARALLELERGEAAYEQALAGLKEFPTDVYLARIAALAQAKRGELQTAANDLRKIMRNKRVPWYFKAELAEIEFQLGNSAVAYQLMCEALQNPQDVQYKLGHLLSLARIALALDKLEVAACHVALAKAVREQEGWSIPSELVNLEREIDKSQTQQEVSSSVVDLSISQLSRRCAKYWGEGAALGRVTARGAIKSLLEDKGFGFIKRDDGEEDIYVKIRNLPRACAVVGARVEFVVVESFDQRKNRSSFQAAQVRCL